MSENMNKLIRELSESLGAPESQLKSAAEQGHFDEILKNSRNPQAQQAREILGDPEKTRELLSSPEAQKLMKLLNGD